MSLFVYVYDSSGVLVNDPSGSLEYAQGIGFDSECPGGYGQCSFEVQRDIAVQWAVKQAYDLKVKDGHVTVFQGRVDGLERALDVNGATIQVRALGWREVLKQRKIRKRWVDNAPIDRMVWPSNRKANQAQQRFDSNKRDDFVLIRGGYGDTVKSLNDSYYEEYVGPTGHYIRRVESNYVIRTGEGFTILWLNGADDSTETSVSDGSGSQVTGTLHVTLAGPDTNSVKLQFRADAADLYDENDRAMVRNVAVFFHYDDSHPDYASPTYTTGEIMIDVVILAGQDDLSGDFDLVTDPGTVLSGFTTRGDKFESGLDLLDRLAAYGDASQNTYVWMVWDDTGASDGLPKVEVRARSTADWEWEATLAEVERLRDELSLDALENWIIVNYTDDEGQEQCLTPDDDALLKDTSSISTYGERHGEIDIGKGTSTEALAIGQRYLEYHKDPLRKSELVFKDKIRNKYGAWLPTSRVRAGDRLRLTDYQGGVTFFLRHVSYKDGVVTCSPDLPVDSLEVFLVRREEKGNIRE